MVVDFGDGPTRLCSGELIAPTQFLTEQPATRSEVANHSLSISTPRLFARFDYVPTHCRTGPRLGFFHFNSVTFRVKNRPFHGHNRYRLDKSTIVTVRGRFNKKLTTAKGTLSLTGRSVRTKAATPAWSDGLP